LGGHIEEFDLNNKKDLIPDRIKRELKEEAIINANLSIRICRINVNEDGNPVNYVHVDFLYF
jgi:predicted NUDIX family phosphoesterase